MHPHNTRQSLITATVALYIPLPAQGFERSKDGILKECSDIITQAIPHIQRYERKQGCMLDEAQFSDIIKQVVLQAIKETGKDRAAAHLDLLDVSAVKERALLIAIRAKRLLIADQFEVPVVDQATDLVGV